MKKDLRFVFGTDLGLRKRNVEDRNKTNRVKGVFFRSIKCRSTEVMLNAEQTAFKS